MSCSFQSDLELSLKRIKGQVHSKAPVLAQRDRLGAGHGFAGGEDGAARGFLVGVDGPLHLHRGEAVLVGMGVLFQPVYIGKIILNILLKPCDLLGQFLADLVLQGVPLAEVIGFQKPEALHINVQVHLLLDVGIAGAERLDLRIGQGGFVNILTGPDRGFAGHDLPDELYFKNLVSTGSYIVSKLRIQEAMADNQLKISKSAYIPTIALFGKQTLYAENLPKNLMPRTLVGVGFTWNIFDGLNREANIRQTRLTKQTLQLGREKAQNELGVLVDKLYSEIQNAKDDVAALNTTIEMSRELVRIRKKSFQEGMATSTDVFDAETMLSKVQIAFLLAYYKYDVALASLLSTCGMPESFWQYSRTGQTENFIFGK